MSYYKINSENISFSNLFILRKDIKLPLPENELDTGLLDWIFTIALYDYSSKKNNPCLNQKFTILTIDEIHSMLNDPFETFKKIPVNSILVNPAFSNIASSWSHLIKQVRSGLPGEQNYENHWEDSIKLNGKVFKKSFLKKKWYEFFPSAENGGVCWVVSNSNELNSIRKYLNKLKESGCKSFEISWDDDNLLPENFKKKFSPTLNTGTFWAWKTYFKPTIK